MDSTETSTEPKTLPVHGDHAGHDHAGHTHEAAALHPTDQEPKRSGPFSDLALEDDGMPHKDDLKTALKAVIDPEIGYNIVDLGLVYDVTKNEDHGVHVLMTLTSMGCPLTEVIHQQCSVVIGAMPGVEEVDVEFTFSPPWSTAFIADWVREEMRALGMNV